MKPSLWELPRFLSNGVHTDWFVNDWITIPMNKPFQCRCELRSVLRTHLGFWIVGLFVWVVLDSIFEPRKVHDYKLWGLRMNIHQSTTNRVLLITVLLINQEWFHIISIIHNASFHFIHNCPRNVCICNYTISVIVHVLPWDRSTLRGGITCFVTWQQGDILDKRNPVVSLEMRGKTDGRYKLIAGNEIFSLAMIASLGIA